MPGLQGVPVSPEVRDAEERDTLVAMGATVELCTKEEPVVLIRDVLERDVCDQDDSAVEYRRGIPGGFTIGTPETLFRDGEEADLDMLETFEPVREEEVIGEINQRRDEMFQLLERVHPVIHRWLRLDRLAARREQTCLRRRIQRQQRRRVHSLRKQVERLEAFCERAYLVERGYQVRWLGCHFRALWNWLVDQLLVLRSRSVGPLLDRLEAIEPQTA